MPRRVAHFGLFAFFLFAFAGAGCSGDGLSVKGSVNVDGQGVGGVRVNFEPTDAKGVSGRATAITKDDGTFEIVPFRGVSPLKPGKYKVLVSQLVDKDGKVPNEEDAGQLEAAGQLKNRLPAKYSNSAKPEFTVDLQAGANNLPAFDVKTK